MFENPYFNPYSGMPRQYSPQQPAQPQTNIIFVNGLEDVKSRLQPCRSQMLYSDNDKNLVYLKAVDDTGHFTVKVFDLVEHKEEQAPEASYLTRAEFEEFKKSLTAKTEEGTSV